MKLLRIGVRRVRKDATGRRVHVRRSGEDHLLPDTEE